MQPLVALSLSSLFPDLPQKPDPLLWAPVAPGTYLCSSIELLNGSEVFTELFPLLALSSMR